MWVVHTPRRVERELDNLPTHVVPALREAIEHLRHDPRPPGCKKLKGRVTCWRIRVGAYRVLYDILDRDRAVVLLKVGPRKDVYRFLQ